MTSRELNQLLVKSFPELKIDYDEEVSWQEGDETGSHVVFGDVFTPYLQKIISDRENEQVIRAFEFIEQLLNLNDEYCDNVIACSVLEGLFDSSDMLEFALPHLGTRTREMLTEGQQFLNS